MPEVASELAVGVSYLTYNFPKLTRALVDKNHELRKLASDSRYTEFTGEISEVIIELEKEGQVPSYNKVRRRLTDYRGFRYRDFSNLWAAAMEQWQST